MIDDPKHWSYFEGEGIRRHCPAPGCERNHGALSLGPGYWFVCHKHKLKWFAGEAKLGDTYTFQQPTAAYIVNHAILEAYEEVENPLPQQ
jgi:hypothetical protein